MCGRQVVVVKVWSSRVTEFTSASWWFTSNLQANVAPPLIHTIVANFKPFCKIVSTKGIFFLNHFD